jgi:hypothetical protein
MPTATPSPTTRPELTNEQLGRMYLRAVAPLNEVVCRFNQVYTGTWDADTRLLFAVQYGQRLRVFADALRAIEWNRDARRDARELITRVAEAEVAYHAVAYATAGRATAWRATDAYDRRQIEAANVLRGTLGLESAGRDC